MADNSKIEWTEATWNPVTGCTEVSPGCDNCYAKTFAERWRGIPGHHFEQGFDVTLRPERLAQPLRWRKPRRIFVNSMSDLFHEAVPDEFIARVFAAMAATPEHTYQLLTKRHGRMRSLLSRGSLGTEGFPDMVENAMAEFTHAGLDVWPLPNVWLGVSVEDQKWADVRINALLTAPAAVRWLSCEPLLGPVNLEPAGGHLVDWVVVGGESGRGARPMHPDWARSLRDQCVDALVPFFFKQWGEHFPYAPEDWSEAVGGCKAVNLDGSETWVAGDEDVLTNYGRNLADGWAFAHRVGKKAAGRELDGRTWDQYPPITAANVEYPERLRVSAEERSDEVSNQDRTEEQQ